MFKFKRWVKILDSGNKSDVDRAADILKNAGIDTKIWASEPMPVGGCGAQMRPTDWSGKKPDIRVRTDMVYHLAVAADDEDNARRLLKHS